MALLAGPTAVDDMRMACGEGALVTGKIHHQRCDFFGARHTPHGLAGDKLRECFVTTAKLFTKGGDTVVPAWAFDGAGADAVTPNALCDIVCGDWVRQ